MCSGMSLLALAAMQAGATVVQGQQQRRAAEFAAQQDANAAAMERDAAAAHAEKVRRAMRSQQGEARAAYAASGVDVNSPSATRIVEDIGMRGEEDALTALLTGERRGTALEGSASMRRQAGRAAQAGSFVQAGSTLMGGYSAQQTDNWRRQRAANPPR